MQKNLMIIRSCYGKEFNDNMQNEKINATPKKSQADQASHFPKPKTTKEIREKYKLNLLKYFTDDTEKRKLEKRLESQKASAKREASSSIKSLKVKKEVEQKYSLQKQRYSNLVKEREDQMKILDEKLSRSARSARSAPDSRNSTSISKWRERSRSRIEKLKEEEDKQLTLKLELYNKKLKQSATNHQQAMEKKAQQVMQHNNKVKVVKQHALNSFMNNDDSLIQEYLHKHQSANSRRDKNRNDFESKVFAKKRKGLEKKLRVDMNKAEEESAKSAKAGNIEQKHFKSLEILQRNRAAWENKLQLKHGKEKAKIENSFERLQRKKQFEMKLKEDILNKHQKISYKLQSRKNSMEKTNEKFREIAVVEAIERDKLKSIKFKISKTREPLKVRSMMSAYVQQ